ncbi:MAG: two-component system sensor histidine kinase HydH [Candidatus Krumholzibacteriia bacterium]|jgi:two-component system sensor histidine kinase HydH
MTELTSRIVTDTPGFWRKYGLALGMIFVISSLHYLTPHGGGHLHDGATPWYTNLHGIYRRLYYFPIILAAFRGGRRGGELSALLVVVMYIPHATGRIGHDPGTPVEKFMEMALYLGIGLVTGILVERANAARSRWQNTAEDLRSALREKTAMETELVRTARLAAVGRLSAGLAHEIRNPLASIQGSAEVLGDDFPEGHPKAHLFRIMLDETARLNGVLSRFLEFARSEPGEQESFDLVAEAKAVQQLMAMQADGAKIEVLGAESLMASGNREQIRQVLFNLAINATAASGSGRLAQFNLVREDDGAVCWVNDSGPGFTAEAMENFGTPFFSTKAEGTGLGLATSLRIVEDLGGSLRIDQNHSDGGSVKLKLPLSPAL